MARHRKNENFSTKRISPFFRTIVTVILFSQCLKEVPIPVPFYKKGQWRILRFQIFKLFPVSSCSKLFETKQEQ